MSDASKETTRSMLEFGVHPVTLAMSHDVAIIPKYRVLHDDL